MSRLTANHISGKEHVRFILLEEGREQQVDSPIKFVRRSQGVTQLHLPVEGLTIRHGALYLECVSGVLSIKADMTVDFYGYFVSMASTNKPTLMSFEIKDLVFNPVAYVPGEWSLGDAF